MSPDKGVLRWKSSRLLPHKNCGECGVPLCITFASQLVGGKRLITDCPNLTEEARLNLEKLYQSPVRGVAIGHNGTGVTLANQRVLFRHELRFFSPTAIAILVDDTLTAQELEERLHRVSELVFARMGYQEPASICWRSGRSRDPLLRSLTPCGGRVA